MMTLGVSSSFAMTGSTENRKKRGCKLGHPHSDSPESPGPGSSSSDSRSSRSGYSLSTVNVMIIGNYSLD
jgi:hypothetical protein